MHAIGEFLDRVPYSRTGLLVALMLVLSIRQMFSGNSYEDVVASMEGAIEERIQRVEQSIDGLSISDAALLSCVRRAALDRAEIPPINSGGIDDVSELTLLYCPRSGIRDLSGIKALSGLTFLDIASNQITSLGPLAGHTKLERLRVQANPLVDIKVVSTLPSLNNIYLPDLREQNCADLEVMLANIKSNVSAISCRGRKEKSSDRRTSRPATSSRQERDSNPHKLTKSENEELLEYERNQRYQRD
jgi:Leucine-rich repeat (LRR) protein